MERHALARGNDDEFIDEFLDMAVPCQCANQILRRLRAFVHPTHCLICTQVIVYDLIDEDMNGTLAKEELVKACGEVSGGVFLRLLVRGRQSTRTPHRRTRTSSNLL